MFDAGARVDASAVVRSLGTDLRIGGHPNAGEFTFICSYIYVCIHMCARASQ